MVFLVKNSNTTAERNNHPVIGAGGETGGFVASAQSVLPY